MKEIQPNQIPTADLRAVTGDFPQAFDLTESAGVNVIHPKGVKLALAFGGAVTLASAFLAACGGGEVTPGVKSIGQGDSNAEAVAKRALKAVISDNDAEFYKLVRPDKQPQEREIFRDDLRRTIQAVRGCNVDKAQFLIRDSNKDLKEVTVLFSQPCGEWFGRPVRTCTVFVDRLSDRWYLTGDDATIFCRP